MKKYYFLAGLPRSGNTLLSSILNQNPDIKVSSNSFLNIHLYNTYHLKYSEQYYNFPDSKSLDNLVSSSFDSYYQDWNAKYIIDRGPWGTPFNLQLLQEYLKNEIKILPIALWSKKTNINLNLTKSLGASSVFKPNIKFLEQFLENCKAANCNSLPAEQQP